MLIDTFVSMNREGAVNRGDVNESMETERLRERKVLGCLLGCFRRKSKSVSESESEWEREKRE